MKTSSKQFETMVHFMERHGDLNRFSFDVRGRIEALGKWHNLTWSLNRDSSGARRSIKKWKKVWSDLKNNTQRKARKINSAKVDKTGKQTTKFKLSNLDYRVLTIMGHQFAKGLNKIKEVKVEPSCIETAKDEETTPSNLVSTKQNPQIFHNENSPEEHNNPGHSTSDEGSSDRCSDASSSHTDESRILSPRPLVNNGVSRSRSQRRDTRLAAAFEASDKRWRRLFSDLASEHLRIRKRELLQQDRWQNLFEKCIDCIEHHFNK